LDYEALALLLVELELLDHRVSARVADGVTRFRWAVAHHNPSPNVGDWHESDLPACQLNVRYRGQSGHSADCAEGPFMTLAV